MDINSQNQNLLGNQISPKSEVFVFWRSFWIQNGCHSKPKWSQYGAACLTPCKYPFQLKSFNFWIFNDFLNFYIGGHFENFNDDLFLCQVSKGSAVWSEFNICCTLVTMATAAILKFFNLPKAATHYGGYFYKVSWSLMKGIQNNFKFKSPLFCFHGNCAKFVQ